MTATLAIVGTDTGIGKTVVGVGLLRALRQRGVSCRAYKPVETGLRQDSPTLTLDGEEADWHRLARASGQPPDTALGCHFPLPAAPLVAARHLGREVPLQDLERRFRLLCDGTDVVLVEGAGGLMVPLSEDRLWADELARWGLTALVVARLGLGTINHTLLTVQALRERRIPVLAVVLNTLTPPGPEAGSTLHTIVGFVDMPVLGPLPAGTTTADDAAHHLAEMGLVDTVLKWRLLSETEA